MKKSIIILGSSASNGETRKVVDYIVEKTNFPVIDLKTKNINHFDYDFNNQDDDFLPTIREIVENYERIIFATPVYWYSMSAILKTFFDRISDCLKVEKDTGRKLRGIEMAVISCAYSKTNNSSFYYPFKASAEYLGMHYIGEVHAWVREDKIESQVQSKLDEFTRIITHS